MASSEQLQQTAKEIRRVFLGMHYQAKSGHIGSGLSAIDLLTYLYWNHLREQDWFILSKGHGASALYATLAVKGIFSMELLKTYYADGTTLPAHPAARAHSAIPFASGSLGHGLPVACGAAYASLKLKKEDRRIVCLLSDGECNEGSVWEAALFAGHHKLKNLTALIDANGIQGFGYTRDVADLEPFESKWRAFGFATDEIDGHRFDQIDAAFQKESQEKPRAVICRTVKGKGVSFMENIMDWHYLPMTEEQYEAAIAQVDKTT